MSIRSNNLRTAASALALVLAACPGGGGSSTTSDDTTGPGSGPSTGGTTQAPTTGGDTSTGDATDTTGDPAATSEPPATSGTTAESTTTTTSTTEPSTTGASTSDPSTSTGEAPLCGDGVVDDDEACDDANQSPGDGCTAECAKECTALRFAGASIASAADPATLHATSVTLAAWHTAAADAPYGSVATKTGNDVGGHITYAIAAGSTGVTARLQTKLDPLEFLDLTAPDAKSDGTWHHIAVTYDAATGDGALYLDGVVVDSETKGTGLVAADPKLPFSVGATPLNGNLEYPSKADITNVVVYGAALTAAEVMGLVDGVYPPGPLAFYTTPEGAGTMSVDASGNGHTLTVPDGGWVDDGPYCAP